MRANNVLQMKDLESLEMRLQEIYDMKIEYPLSEIEKGWRSLGLEIAKGVIRVGTLVEASLGAAPGLATHNVPVALAGATVGVIRGRVAPVLALRKKAETESPVVYWLHVRKNLKKGA